MFLDLSCHVPSAGDDCIGIWSTGIENMRITNVTAANCAVTAGAQSNVNEPTIRHGSVHYFVCLRHSQAYS